MVFTFSPLFITICVHFDATLCCLTHLVSIKSTYIWLHDPVNRGMNDTVAYTTGRNKLLQNASSTDLRIRRTRKLLRDALVDLIDQHGFEAIKVTDIADRAMVNRTTFYRHYQDKDDLLIHCMDDVFHALKARVQSPTVASGAVNHRAPAANLELLLVHVAEHADFYRVMLGMKGSAAFTNRLRDYLITITRTRWNHIGVRNVLNPGMPPDLVLQFIASAYIGVIAWWVANGCNGTPSRIADHMHTLTQHGPYPALGLTPPDEH